MPRLFCFVLVISLCFRCVAAAGPADLRTFASDHYQIHTDLDSDLAADLAHRMDVMWEEYARRLCDFSPPRDGPKLEAYLFQFRRDYVHLTNNRLPNTCGAFIPAQNLLAVYLEDQGRDGIRRTLQHEAFHQFAYSAIGKTMPIWLNEGIAQIFEEGIWTGHEFLLGQVPPLRVRLLQEDIRQGRLADFGEFINRSDMQWASNLRYKPIAMSQYNQAWAMTQFLIYATDEDGEAQYRDRLLDMLRLIHAGRDGHRAFVDAFSDNTTGFQRKFTEWAHNLSPSAEATYTEHQAVLADMLMSLGERGRQFADVASFRSYLEMGGFRLQRSGSDQELPALFFRDVRGQPLGPAQLYFSMGCDAFHPDIVCHPTSSLEYRTHFLMDNGKLDYETVVQAE